MLLVSTMLRWVFKVMKPLVRLLTPDSVKALYRRPTKAFQDAVAGGGAGLRLLTLRNAYGAPVPDGSDPGAGEVGCVSSDQARGQP